MDCHEQKGISADDTRRAQLRSPRNDNQVPDTRYHPYQPQSFAPDAQGMASVRSYFFFADFFLAAFFLAGFAAEDFSADSAFADPDFFPPKMWSQPPENLMLDPVCTV